MFSEQQRQGIAQSAASPPAISLTRIGLSAQEIRSYSLARAIGNRLPTYAGGAPPWDRKMTLERAASDAVAAALNRDPRSCGILVPEEIQTRADIVGTSSAGGYLTDSPNVSFIDRLRNVTVAYRLGAMRLPGLVGNANIPKLVDGTTTTWLTNETTQVGEVEQTFGQLSLSPKTIASYTEMSRQLLLQSIPASDIIVTYDLAQMLGVGIDAAVINGPGSAGAPHGIIGLTGVTTSSGATLTQTMLRAMQTTTSAANSPGVNFGYAMAPVTAQILSTRQRFTGASVALWEGDQFFGTVEGAPGMSSAQVPAATIVAGPWSEVIIAEWGVLEVDLNPYLQANFQAGIVGIRALWTIDVGVRRPATFSVLTSVS